MQKNTSFDAISSKFTVLRTHVSTDDRQLCLIDIFIFPIALSNIHRQITNYVKIDRTACLLMCGDISIEYIQITSWYITRHVSINVDVSDCRWFKLQKHALLNRYTSAHNYNYPYLLEYIENFQVKYIKILHMIPIKLD